MPRMTKPPYAASRGASVSESCRSLQLFQRRPRHEIVVFESLMKKLWERKPASVVQDSKFDILRYMPSQAKYTRDTPMSLRHVHGKRKAQNSGKTPDENRMSAEPLSNLRSTVCPWSPNIAHPRPPKDTASAAILSITICMPRMCTPIRYPVDFQINA